MKQYFYHDEAVTVLWQTTTEAGIEFKDGTEETVLRSDLKKKTVRNPERAKKNFQRNFGSKNRVLQVKRLPCLICSRLPSDNAHIVSRGAGGTKNDIVPLCRQHHEELDRVGVQNFEQKYSVNLREQANKLQIYLDNPLDFL